MRRLRLSPWLIAACALALALGRALEFTGALLCIFAHECAHALAARLIGFTVQEIRLSPAGASLRLFPQVQESAVCEIVVSAAGPAASFALGLLFFAAHRAFALPWLRMLAVYNVFFGAFNLLPALPMDGGRVLRAALGLFLTHAQATRVCAALGVVCGAALTVLAFLGAGEYGLNVTLLLCGVLIASQALAARRQAVGAGAFASYKKCDAVRGGGSLLVREIAVGADKKLADVARDLKGDAFYRIGVYDENMKKLCTSDEARLAEAIARYGAQERASSLCR